MHPEVFLTCVAVVALVVLYRRDAARVQRERGRLFARCVELFSSYRIEQEGRGFPVLNGTYCGRRVRLEPIVDHLAWRKLPVLWLQVTVLQPTRFGAVLDLLTRATGAEYFSHIYNLAHRLQIPAHWPQEALLYTDDPDRLPPLDVLQPHARQLSDPKLKELVITPNGVRVVYRVAEAARAHYATFREMRFDVSALTEPLAAQVLDAAVAIAESASVREAERKVA